MSITIESEMPRESESTSGAEELATNRRHPKPKSVVSRLWNSSMKLIRRIHLYSGLFMFPWVLLYGFTGWFFNHPRYFTGDDFQAFAATQVIDGQLSELPTAAEVAQQVVNEINGARSGPKVEIVNQEEARFDRYLTFSVDADRQSHVVTLHPDTGDGSIRTTKKDEEHESVAKEGQPTNPLRDIRQIQLESNTQSKAADLVPDLLDELNLETGEAKTGRSSASVVFAALVDERRCTITYDMSKGSVSARAADAAKNDLEIKSFLQRLHLSRGYTPNIETRTWWAVSVDAMFLSMVFWGVSGILMWWQIKRTRFLGGITLISSLICATLLTMGMHDEIASRNRRRGEDKRPVAKRPADSKREQSKAGRVTQTPGGTTDSNARLTD